MALSTPLRSDRPFTYLDLEGLEDDANVYEISYGALIVTPWANARHQAIETALAAFLHARKPGSMTVLVETQWMSQPDLVKQPDVQVVEKDLVAGSRIVGTPGLVVEIHSSSTRVIDLTEKRHVYAEAGIPAYWMVDPVALTLTVLELREGVYVELGVVGADDTFDVTIPFPMTLEGGAIFE
jgi:Uma2 family endonuclease